MLELSNNVFFPLDPSTMVARAGHIQIGMLQ
jgi:hypothetical protein